MKLRASREYTLAYNRLRSASLTDSYVAAVLRRRYRGVVITDEMIKLKRASMRLKREMKAAPLPSVDTYPPNEPGKTGWYADQDPYFNGLYERFDGDTIEIEHWGGKGNWYDLNGVRLSGNIKCVWRGLTDIVVFKPCCNQVISSKDLVPFSWRIGRGREVATWFSSECKDCTIKRYIRSLPSGKEYKPNAVKRKNRKPILLSEILLRE